MFIFSQQMLKVKWMVHRCTHQAHRHTLFQNLLKRQQGKAFLGGLTLIAMISAALTLICGIYFIILGSKTMCVLYEGEAVLQGRISFGRFVLKYIPEPGA